MATKKKESRVLKKGVSMENTGYKVVETEERYLIVDRGTVAAQKNVSPNLIEGEVKIIRLSAKDRPLKVSCIELEGKQGEEVTSICKNLGNYHHIRSTLPCLYDGYSERDILNLIPDPESVKAKYARTRFLPGGNSIQKSHAHLVCEK